MLEGQLTLDDFKTVFKYRKLWGVYIGQFAVTSCQWFFLTWFPTYLIEFRHYSFVKSGLYASIPFLAAFLASHTGYYAARVYVEEARRLGAAILGPDINRSGADYAFARLKGWPGLRAGLGQVRGLSEDTVAAILSSREADGPFLSLPDVIERAGKAIDKMIEIGRSERVK